MLRPVILFGCLFPLLTICDGHFISKDGFVGIGVNLSNIPLLNKLAPGPSSSKKVEVTEIVPNKDGCPKFFNFTCGCSPEDTPIAVPVTACSYFHRRKMRCKPCNDLTPDDVCPKYALCEQCHLNGGDSCVACPKNKFGTWCENTCKCLNNGTCQRDGQCVCQHAFEGAYCEKKKPGCSPFPALSPPLEVVYDPPQYPLSAVFSCPPDYMLSGPAVSVCVRLRWASKPPTCRSKCPNLSTPSNGRLEFSGSDLVEGITAEVECNQGYRLVGQKSLRCMSGGQWSSELPICEEIATCPDPGNVQNAERSLLPSAVKIGGHFLQDSKIQYTCKAGFEQLGVSKILCTFEGNWSQRLPSCLKVSTVVPTCETAGSKIMEAEGSSVRIFCPPECSDEDEFGVWGTSIYRAQSSVCRAAKHSAKITNSGGPVAIINNGPYSHFTGSYSNNIESESYPDKDDSFRFDKVTSNQPRASGECEKGLVKLETTCVYVSNLLRTYENAKAVCTNLGLHLELPIEPDEKERLIEILNSKGIKFIWGDDQFKMTEEREEEKEEEEVEEEIPSSPEEVTLTNEKASYCPVASIDELELKPQKKLCNEVSNYVCMRKSDASSLAICSDPGPLANGRADAIGKIDNVFYVGSSINYSCQTLHYLRGEKTVSCTSNGTWSAKKPECVKVDACEEVPVPIGGFVTYLAPIKSGTQQRSGVYQTRIPARAARLPTGLAAPIPQNIQMSTTPEPVTVPLPEGLYRLGARAVYDCESRYYNLIGSRTRTCRENGQWSGRPPTCMPVCGRSDSPRSPFIVNGNATDIGQWPWQGGIARYLQDYNRWFLLCGASLINEQWLITAAHCLTYAGTTLSIEPDKFQVYVGKYHRDDNKDDEYVQVRKIKEIQIHPDYDPGLFDADIALILLESPVQLNSRVQPVCLPTEQTTRENLAEGKLGVVTGWGMNENETYSETLQQAVLPVVSQERCEKGYEESELPLTVTDNMFCAGYAQGKSDACSGDSGGPMVFTDSSSKQRKWVLEGIVSWGSPRGCGNANQYGGFTTVSRFLPWIHNFF